MYAPFPCVWAAIDGSTWANLKTGDLQDILTKEVIEATIEKPKKLGKGILEAYKAAATEEVDLEALKMEDEDEDEEMEDAEEEEEEEEEDAALEDVKDLYDEDDSSVKKRKRADDDGDVKTSKKKVSLLTADSLLT